MHNEQPMNKSGQRKSREPVPRPLDLLKQLAHPLSGQVLAVAFALLFLFQCMILPLVGKAAMGGSGSPGAGPAPTLWKNLVFFSVMLMVTLLTGVLAFYSKWLRRREDHSPFPLVTAILLGLTLAILIAFTTGSLRL